MGATTRYDFAAYIRNQGRGDYPKIAELIRKGDISCLCQDARDLLADYLEGKKLPRGGKTKDQATLSQHLCDEMWNLETYGRTSDEIAEYFRKNATSENYKSILETLKSDKKITTKARAYLAKKEGMSIKNIEAVTNNYSKKNSCNSSAPQPYQSDQGE